MSIRRIVAVVLAVTSCFAIAGAVALVIMTTAMRGVAAQLRASVEGVQASEELRVDLLRYARHSDLAVLSQGEDARAKVEIEARLDARLQMVREYAGDLHEQRLVQDVAARIDEYLADRRVAEATYHDLQVVISVANDSLQTALAVLSQLTQHNVDQSQAAFAQAKAWDATSDAIGGLVALVLLGLVPAALFWMSARVLRPLTIISRTMRDYGEGGQEARVPAMGATELQQIGTSFNQLADSLARQHERQLTSIAAIAHDLRNPLNALLLAATMADRDPSASAMARALTITRRQTLRLERMVADLLDTAYIEAGKLNLRLQSCDLRGSVSEAFNLYTAASPRHRLHLTLPPEPVAMMCDPFRVEQVFNNLLSNAIKYSPDGGSVDVELRVEKRAAVVSVADEGIGIPAPAIRQVFQPFGRVKGPDERIPGTGLGLSVARRIVEAHGGQIEVFSTDGRGSVFRVCLPLATADGTNAHQGGDTVNVASATGGHDAA